MRVKVLRAFFLDGKVQEAGTVVDIADRPLLGGLRAGGKVEPIGADEPAGPMTTETSGLVAGKRAKAKADAKQETEESSDDQ